MNRLIPARIRNFITENLQLFAVLIIPVIISFFKPNFLSIRNFNNILDLSSILIITAVGFAFIVQLGAIDLSIEYNMALAGVVMAKLLGFYPKLGILSIFIAMFSSAFVGLINGLIYTKLKIPSFLTTLGMSYIAYGLCTVITQGQYINYENLNIRELAIGRVGGANGIIPNSLVIALIVSIIAIIISEKTKYGRYVLAIGGDELITKDLGIKVDSVKLTSFILAGAAFGLAGALLSLKLGAGDSFSAVGYTFETISACVIGGISISGGVGKIHKAILGALIITIIRVAMVFFVIPSTVQAGFLGIVIILTVALTLDRSKIVVIK